MPAARPFRFGSLVAATLLCLLGWYSQPGAAQDQPSGQDPPNAADEKPAADQPETKPDAQPAEGATAAEQFKAKLQEWKDLIKSLRDLKVRFGVAENATEADDIRQTWQRLVEKGRGMITELREAGKKAYLEAPNADRELTRFLEKILEDEVKRDLYGPAFELGTLLIENNCDKAEVYTLAGIAAFATHDFAKAKEYLQKAKDANVLHDVGPFQESNLHGFLAQADEYQKFWELEQQRRKQDEEETDPEKMLPRVKFTTTKGDIVLELFENEAPQTVGNFIHLVEDGFYNGIVFHRVLPGFMAQCGCPNGDGSGGPGYEIYDETDKPEARKHFRGSLSMANTGLPNSGGSQFFLTFLPTPHLNGRHTVFGRVVEGMDVLTKLERNASQNEGPENPDKITNAEVLRKRDHKYLPTKVKG